MKHSVGQIVILLGFSTPLLCHFIHMNTICITNCHDQLYKMLYEGDKKKEGSNILDLASVLFLIASKGWDPKLTL